MVDYKNVVALVAGCTGGLGGTTTATLLSLGAKVIGVDIETIAERKVRTRENNDAARTVDEVLKGEFPGKIDLFVEKAERAGRFVMHRGDITSSEVLQSCFGSIDTSRGERLALAVNCAGYSERMMVYRESRDRMMDDEHLSLVFQDKVTCAFNFIRLCAQQMSRGAVDSHDGKERGVIINTSGIQGFDGQEYMAAASAADGAINSMTLPMSRDLAHCNIRVNTISPGHFKTNLVWENTRKMDPTVEKFLGSLNAFPFRLGKPHEFAQCVLDVYENGMMNGEVVRLDAGCRLPP